MFALNLRRVYRICDKVIIRNLRSRRRFDEVNSANPGLQRRIDAFREDGVQIKDEDVEEFFEKSDTDFFNVNKAHKDLQNERRVNSQVLKQNIIKERYFKENMPNLLTWSEKEQIRHLASSAPDEWTPEKIAESFPITIDVVKKLLKYPWKPATEERIARHDASALRNWRELKDGTLQIPEDLRKHFLKFSERSIPPLRKDSLKIEINPGNNIGEFESIIRRCAEKENGNQTEENIEVNSSSSNLALSKGSENTYKEKKTKRDTKLMTLEELQEKVKKRLEKGSKVGADDQLMLHTISTQESENQEENLSDVKNEIELNDQLNEKQITVFKNSNENDKDIMDYPQRIRIPKKAYKKGATYKVNDCYYDHDGIFLYRVLGMSK